MMDVNIKISEQLGDKLLLKLDRLLAILEYHFPVPTQLLLDAEAKASQERKEKGPAGVEALFTRGDESLSQYELAAEHYFDRMGERGSSRQVEKERQDLKESGMID